MVEKGANDYANEYLDIEKSVNQTFLTNWLSYHKALKDSPHTGDLMFVAGQHLGDYHNYFTINMTFKTFNRIGLTREDFLMHLQREKDNGALGLQKEPDFFDFESMKGKRKLIVLSG